MATAGTPSAFTKPDTGAQSRSETVRDRALPDTPAYPPLPGIFDVPWHLISPWATAQTHIWVILVYLDGLDSYLHAPELTTGHGLLCSTAWGESCDEMPGCPGTTHGPADRLPRCSCRYFHERTRMVIHEGRSPQSIFLVVGTGFAIDRDCLHHGDAALVYPLHSPVDPAFWDKLDEHERGGH